MKKTSTILAAFLALAFGAKAQEQTGSSNQLQPKFGIKLGANLSNLYAEEVSDNNLKLGPALGFYGKIPVTKGLSLQPELLYSNKGAKATYNNFVLGRGEYRFNLHYVEVPLLAVINLAPNFNIQAGPYAGYLAGANVKDMNEDGTINGTAELNAENFNRFDYGVAAGFGIDLKNTTIGARYHYGLREIGSSGLAGQLTSNSKNSALTFFIGFAF
jgi:hypothetical protein